MRYNGKPINRQITNAKNTAPRKTFFSFVPKKAQAIDILNVILIYDTDLIFWV